MLNLRLYRAAFLPFVFALAIAAFSLTGTPRGFTSTLAPDAFDGSRAFADLNRWAAEFPTRRPGGPGDEALANRISHELDALGGAAGGGFSVRSRRFEAQTIDGRRSLTMVIAQRPGSTGAPPIVLLAHRDAAGRDARAELSGTAALLELARVFAARETQRAIILVSTSGGSGGDAGAADFAAHASPADAVIVLGDLAGTRKREPLVVPFSDGFGSAPAQLQRTVSDALGQEAGVAAGAPSTAGQLAHLTLPFATGEQGVLDAGGLPAVLVQASGELGPSPGQSISASRLEGFGRAVLSAVDALDVSPDVDPARQTGLVIQHKTVPVWAVRLLVLALLLPPLVVLADGLARLRRRRERVGRWLPWTLACSLPFFLAVMFARLLAWSGLLGVAPAVPVLPRALPFDATAATTVMAVALVLILAWLAWPLLVRRLGADVRPNADGAGLVALFVLLAVCTVVCVANPFAALLLLPAVHLYLLIVSPELRPRPPAGLAIVVLALVPLGLLIVFDAHRFGMGPGEVAWTAVLLAAGGHVGVLAAALWSLALGVVAAILAVALTVPAALAGPDSQEREEIVIRGPLSYAGPGSLGGTESAMRR
ncbi:MAG TPA: M28 family peptidase [Solirubrobacteraceae bacterium]|jgi:hypothetical protein